jgi:hypothetical protein
MLGNVQCTECVNDQFLLITCHTPNVLYIIMTVSWGKAIDNVRVPCRKYGVQN